jgi:hypothetical protein
MTPALIAISVIGLTTVVSFWGWLAVKVIHQGTKLIELEGRMNAQEHESCTIHGALAKVFEKLDTVADGVSEIRGYLKAQKGRYDG